MCAVRALLNSRATAPPIRILIPVLSFHSIVYKCGVFGTVES